MKAQLAIATSPQNRKPLPAPRNDRGFLMSEWANEWMSKFINDQWRAANDAKQMTRSKWRAANDAQQMTHSKWRKANDAQQMTRSKWREANDAQQMTQSKWREANDAQQMTRSKWPIPPIKTFHFQ